MGKIYEIARPKSLDDSAYEDYEYLIRWIGKDGADYQYMFYNAEFQTRISGSVANRLDADKIESLIESEENEVTLFANDLSKNDLTIIGSLLSCKYVTRLKKDGTAERYATDSNRFKYILIDKRYNIEFTLIMNDCPVWK